MDKNEVRRSRLRQLVDERFSGKVLRLASHLDMKAPQLHRWLSGKQGIHEDSARGIEAKTDLPRGWLDIPPDADRDTGHTAGSAVSPSSDAQGSPLPPQSPIAPLAARWPFKHVDQRAYDALPAEGQIWVQGKISAAIDEAARLFATATGKRSA